jgi:hypothetical protein
LEVAKQKKLSQAKRWINTRKKNQSWAFSQNSLKYFIDLYHKGFSSEDWENIPQMTK